MRVRTTVREFPRKAKTLGILPDTEVEVIVKESSLGSAQISKKEKQKKQYLFLDDDVWEGEETPTDLSTNVDYYLYDLDNPHGE